MFRLRYFTILCNTNEYKMIDQGASQGYDVQNEIKISKKHWLGLRIYYDSIDKRTILVESKLHAIGL